MHFPIARLYPTQQVATEAAQDLERRGFHAEVTHVFAGSDDSVAQAIAGAGVAPEHAEIYAERLRQGAALVVLDPPLGTGNTALAILDQYHPVAVALPEIVRRPAGTTGMAGDNPAPLSAALGWRVLSSDPAPLSTWLGWSALKREPAVSITRENIRLQSREAAPLSRALGLRVLSRNPAPLSARLGWRTLSDTAAPLSKKAGWRVLLDDPTPLSSTAEVDDAQPQPDAAVLAAGPADALAQRGAAILGGGRARPQEGLRGAQAASSHAATCAGSAGPTSCSTRAW